MGEIETNQSLANLLGWAPADFGASSFNTSLITAIREAQGKLGVTIDGLCGKYTYGALLKQRQEGLLAQRGTSVDWLADAGTIAMCEAKATWLRNIVDLPPPNDTSYERCRKAIDDMIRSPAGLAWAWQPPYQDDYEWCGAFAGFSWRAAGLIIGLRKTYFASTYRLDRYGRYKEAFENTPNPRPTSGPTRQIVELNEHSGPFDAHFANNDPPRAGDILLVGGKNTAYGKHVTIVESYDLTSGVFTTLEGNATGRGPTGGTRHGVIRGKRPVGLPNGSTPTTYHARRLMRPAPVDLT
jgi:hypothetical protein